MADVLSFLPSSGPLGGQSGLVDGAVRLSSCPYKGEVKIAVEIAETIAAFLSMAVLHAKETCIPD
jgi:hypothetical protein